MKRTVKRTIVAITISLTLLVTGILYGGNTNRDCVKKLNLEEAYTAQFPEKLPDLVIDPMQGFPVY